VVCRRTRDENEEVLRDPTGVIEWPGVRNLERALEVSGTTLFQNQKTGDAKRQGSPTPALPVFSSRGWGAR